MSKTQTKSSRTVAKRSKINAEVKIINAVAETDKTLKAAE